MEAQTGGSVGWSEEGVRRRWSDLKHASEVFHGLLGEGVSDCGER